MQCVEADIILDSFCYRCYRKLSNYGIKSMNTSQYLHQAWGEASRLYQLARVNSERTLQAILYSQLVAILPPKARVLCEPTIKVPDSDAVIPDLVVVMNNAITAVVEIKFVPHGYPIYKKDINKLRTYGCTKSAFQLILEPHTGKYLNKYFTFSKDCLLVFAVIARHDSAAVDEKALNEQMRRFADRFVLLVYPVNNQA